MKSNNIYQKNKEIQAYEYLLNIMVDYEKYALLGYSDNNEKNLLFFNTKRIDLNSKIMTLVIKNKILNLERYYN